MTTKGLAVLSDCAAAGIGGDPSSGANYLGYHSTRASGFCSAADMSH